ncbi:MAG TPA: thiamine phosphate synthase [Xanthobacteraceae bacterium]|jgi:thiamine-phosphate pyrophosphorylase
MRVDLRLYALIDPEHAGGRNVVALARLAAEAGATIIQLRDKRSSTRSMVDDARSIKAALAPLHVPFLINDRVDVALACGADGVHLGQDDMRIKDARRLLGSSSIIGLSIKAVAEADDAPLDLLDYVGIGGVFATTSKDNPAPPIGIAGLARIIEAVRRRAPNLPACAIAGITLENAAETIAAGGDGIAVISAISLQGDPHAAAQRLRAAVDGALGKRQGL